MSRTSLGLVMSVLCVSLAFGASVKSRTTSLREGCTSLNANAMIPVSLCPGVDDYQLVVQSDSLRENLSVRTPSGDVDLNFPKAVSAAPSRLADTVEWRIVGGKASALIARLAIDSDPNDDPSDQPNGATGPSGQLVNSGDGATGIYDNYKLVVIKLDGRNSCVVDAFLGTSNQDASMNLARRQADQAQSMACIVLPHSVSTSSARPRPNTSGYTSALTSLVVADHCTDLPVPAGEGEAGRALCPGVAPYQLIAELGEDAESITVKAGAKEMPLDLQSKVSAAPSFVGDQAEFRLENGKPVSLILRMHLSTEPGSGRYNEMQIVIAKLDPQASCVVSTIDGKSPGANARSLRIADRARSMPCL